MWIGNGYVVPIINTPKGPGPGPLGNFIELESNLFLIALESGLNDLIELE
jgi:hypothetical protein